MPIKCGFPRTNFFLATPRTRQIFIYFCQIWPKKSLLYFFFFFFSEAPWTEFFFGDPPNKFFFSFYTARHRSLMVDPSSQEYWIQAQFGSCMVLGEYFWNPGWHPVQRYIDSRSLQYQIQRVSHTLTSLCCATHCTEKLNLPLVVPLCRCFLSSEVPKVVLCNSWKSIL